MMIELRETAVVVCLIAFAGAAAAADTSRPSRAAQASKAPAMEKLTCRSGPNDEQARLIAQIVRGRPMEFAYYSRLGTKVCSIHGRRGDAYTKWEDLGPGKTAVRLLTGNAQLEYSPGLLRITFADVERMQYCGTEGELNGSIEVSSKKSECALTGVFD